MIRRPPRSTRTYTPCPYTTLVRSMDQTPSLASATAQIAASDLVPYSPVTEKWVGRQVALPDLCAATMTTSDNTAANKVLQALGGPMAVTRFARSLGEDRKSTRLNSSH